MYNKPLSLPLGFA